MKNSILNLGKILNKNQQQTIKGSSLPAPTEYNFCCYPATVQDWINEYGFRPNYTCYGYVCGNSDQDFGIF